MKFTNQHKTVRVATRVSDLELLKEAVGNRTASGNPYAEALRALEKMSHEEGIPLAVIGGAASIYHGNNRSTKDIDVAVSAEHFDDLVRSCHEYGFKSKSYNPTGIHELSYKGIDIEVAKEGMFAADPRSPVALPHPKELGVSKGFGFANLPSWVRLKISGGRPKDEEDIIEVLANKPPEVIQQVEQYLRTLPPEYLQKFNDLKDQIEWSRQAKQRANEGGRSVPV